MTALLPFLHKTLGHSQNLQEFEVHIDPPCQCWSLLSEPPTFIKRSVLLINLCKALHQSNYMGVLLRVLHSILNPYDAPASQLQLHWADWPRL